MIFIAETENHYVRISAKSMFVDIRKDYGIDKYLDIACYDKDGSIIRRNEALTMLRGYNEYT